MEPSNRGYAVLPLRQCPDYLSALPCATGGPCGPTNACIDGASLTLCSTYPQRRAEVVYVCVGGGFWQRRFSSRPSCPVTRTDVKKPPGWRSMRWMAFVGSAYARGGRAIRIALLPVAKPDGFVNIASRALSTDIDRRLLLRGANPAAATIWVIYPRKNPAASGVFSFTSVLCSGFLESLSHTLGNVWPLRGHQ